MHDWNLANRMKNWHITFPQKEYDKLFLSAKQFSSIHDMLFNLHWHPVLFYDILKPIAANDLAQMIDHPDASGRSLLTWAAEFSCLSAINCLPFFDADAQQVCRNKDGGYSSLIHLATAGPDSGWVCLDKTETVRQLLQAGAPVNKVDSEGWTAKLMAAS